MILAALDYDSSAKTGSAMRARCNCRGDQMGAVTNHELDDTVFRGACAVHENFQKYP